MTIASVIGIQDEAQVPTTRRGVASGGDRPSTASPLQVGQP